jgi:dolichol-phosphate mannosyltransferase
MMRIIIPAYNEAKNVPAVVQEISQALGQMPYEIILVNDGSTDTTAAIAEELKLRFPIVVLSHPSNRGVAEVFRTGLTHTVEKSQAEDIIVIMEGDGTSDPQLLPELAQRIQDGADLVIASRYQPGGAYKHFPLKRLLLSRGANLVFRLLFPIKNVKDYSIFYRAYRAQCLKLAMAHYHQQFITVQTFFANIEILFHLQPFVKRIEEVPLVYDYGKKQGKSSMKIGKNLRSYLLFIAHHVFKSPHH